MRAGRCSAVKEGRRDSLHGPDTVFLLCSSIYKLSISPEAFDSLINELLPKTLT